MTGVAAALGRAAVLGPYFRVELAAHGPDWRELAALVDDPARLRERVAVTRSLLADQCGTAPEAIDERAAASIFLLGLAARLVSPAFGAAVMTWTVPVIAVRNVRWQPVDGGPTPIAVASDQTRAAGTLDELADLLYDDVVLTTVWPVVDAVQREFRLSPKVLGGNVASALAGSAKMLGLARPDLASRATRLAERLLRKGWLCGTGCYVRVDPAGSRRQFVRNNCCLFYRVPGGGTCADCVLGRFSG